MFEVREGFDIFCALGSLIFMVCYFPALGIKDYCERYAQGAVNVQNETFQQIPVLYDTETATKIQEEFQTSLPVDKLQDRRKWRDSMLAGLAKFKSDSKKEDSS